MYDANGNALTDAQGRSFTWNVQNRLIQAVVPGQDGGTTTFQYDPFGRRIQKSGPLGTTNYLYDGKNVEAEIDNTGAVLARYINRPWRLDQPLAESRSGAPSYYEQDALGAVTSLTNSAAALSNTYSYDSYGMSETSTGVVADPLKYTGRELDNETGLYYYRARYYDPGLGRFMSEDPSAFEGGMDFYAYALNDPVDLKDPLGLDYQVTTDGQGNIAVTAVTILIGPNSSPLLADTWTRDANNWWNAGKWKYGKCNVTFNLKFIYDLPSPDSNDPMPENTVYVTANPLPSNVLAMTLFGDTGFWWSGLTGQDLAHESGHLFGLPDDYGLLSFGNHHGHMMSNSIIRNVVQHEVDDVLNGKACECKQ